jgi:hypothetical protein
VGFGLPASGPSTALPGPHVLIADSPRSGSGGMTVRGVSRAWAQGTAWAETTTQQAQEPWSGTTVVHPRVLAIPAWPEKSELQTGRSSIRPQTLQHNSSRRVRIEPRTLQPRLRTNDLVWQPEDLARVITRGTSVPLEQQQSFGQVLVIDLRPILTEPVPKFLLLSPIYSPDRYRGVALGRCSGPPPVLQARGELSARASLTWTE